MPFIALLYVSDDDTANAIRAGELPVTRKEIRYVGLYRWPTKADLRCNGCTSRKGNGWRRSREGWMECSTCGGRDRKVRRWIIGGLFDWLGCNLLRRVDTPRVFQNPPDWD